jgi:hypothetical protein
MMVTRPQFNRSATIVQLYLELLVVPTSHRTLPVTLVACVKFTQDADKCELPAEQYSTL